MSGTGLGKGSSATSGWPEARRIAQPPGASQSITDVPYRIVSIYPSMFFARLGISPNKITVFWVLLGLGGDAGLGFSNYWVRVTAAAAFQFSYLMDYVDGEVARLEHRTSKRGFLLDLVGHCLVKTGIFLGIGYHVVLATGKIQYLILAFLASVSVSNLNSLHTLASYAGVSNKKKRSDSLTPVGQRSHALTLRRIAGLLGLFFESPGVYGLVLIAAISERSTWLLFFYGVCGPIWFVFLTAKFRYE